MLNDSVPVPVALHGATLVLSPFADLHTSYYCDSASHWFSCQVHNCKPPLPHPPTPLACQLKRSSQHCESLRNLFSLHEPCGKTSLRPGPVQDASGGSVAENTAASSDVYSASGSSRITLPLGWRLCLRWREDDSVEEKGLSCKTQKKPKSRMVVWGTARLLTELATRCPLSVLIRPGQTWRNDIDSKSVIK